MGKTQTLPNRIKPERTYHDMNQKALGFSTRPTWQQKKLRIVLEGSGKHNL